MYRRVPLTASGPPDPLTLEQPPGPWRPVDEVLGALAEAAAAGERLVVLTGHRPARCPHLGPVVAAGNAAGLAIALQALPLGLEPEALHALGVSVLVVPLHGPAPLHDALTAPGAHAGALAVLGARRPRVRVRVGLSRRNCAGIGAAVADAAGADRVTLTGAVPEPLAGGGLAVALEAAWTAARGAEVDLVLEDAHVPPDLGPGPVRDLDPNLEALRRAGGWLPGLSSGVRTAPDDATAARLHALGMPAVGAPPPRSAARVEGEVLVVVPHIGDTLLALSTLPALVRALRARGVPARLASPWERPWNLRAPEVSGLDEGVHLRALYGGAEGPRQEVARRLSPRLLARLELRGISRVIVPGFAAGAAVRHHPERGDAAVEVVDLHLLDGVEAWAPEGVGRPDAPWPDPRASVTSCFPGFLPNYLAKGVPVEALRFRPYPVAREHLPEAVGDGDALLVAGNQRRDHATLAAALAALPRGHAPVQLLSREPPPPGADVEHLGHVSVPELAEAVARARCVVLPVESHPRDAAGITVAALALALGRPIVGTTAWGLVDHVRHDEAGLLVPPGDPAALADALARVDGDPALRRRLAEGARHAGALLSVQAWADALVTGEAPPWPVRGPVPGAGLHRDEATDTPAPTRESR